MDKMGANISLVPLYTCSRRGESAFGSAPRNGGKNLTLLASITGEGLGPCLVVEGPTTREVSLRPTWSVSWCRVCVPGR